jgi:hypothetical protein
MRIRETYQDKAKRDARWKELKERGVNCFRRTTGPSYVHPMYIRDFSGPEKQDTGFGNTVYKTFFKNLYVVEEF